MPYFFVQIGQKQFFFSFLRYDMSNQAPPALQLPSTGFLRISQILGNPKAHPASPPIIPVSRSTWWAGVKSGLFPAPVKLGPRVTAWRVEDIRALIESRAATAEEA